MFGSNLSGDIFNKIIASWNNLIENFDTKVMRGVKKPDSVIFDGSQIYHNYLRPHIGLDDNTPDEVWGIEIKGKDKWKTIIQNASK